MRSVDKTKKSNVKCEHCEYFCKDYDEDNNCREVQYCGLTGEDKNYWNRCKYFKWSREIEKRQ